MIYVRGLGDTSKGSGMDGRREHRLNDLGSYKEQDVFWCSFVHRILVFISTCTLEIV